MFDLYSLTICNGLTPFDNERELLIARDRLLVFTLQSADEAADEADVLLPFLSEE